MARKSRKAALERDTLPNVDVASSNLVIRSMSDGQTAPSSPASPSRRSTSTTTSRSTTPSRSGRAQARLRRVREGADDGALRRAGAGVRRRRRSSGPTATCGSPRTRRRTRPTRARSWRPAPRPGGTSRSPPAASGSAAASTRRPGTRLAAIRAAMADDTTGPRLLRIVRKLERAGFEIGGEQLKTAPRGYDADHPRIDLLRRKQLFAGRSYGFEDVIHTPAGPRPGARRLEGAAPAGALADRGAGLALRPGGVSRVAPMRHLFSARPVRLSALLTTVVAGAALVTAPAAPAAPAPDSAPVASRASTSRRHPASGSPRST